jgi:hypothetical protein
MEYAIASSCHPLSLRERVRVRETCEPSQPNHYSLGIYERDIIAFGKKVDRR